MNIIDLVPVNRKCVYDVKSVRGMKDISDHSVVLCKGKLSSVLVKRRGSDRGRKNEE